MPTSRPQRRTTDSGHVPFVWVRDPDTGHAYDVPENAIPDSVTVVADYPLNYSGKARRVKFFVDKGGVPSGPASPVSAPVPPDGEPAEMGGAAATSTRKAVK